MSEPKQSPLFMSVPRWALARVGRHPTQRSVLFALCAFRSKRAGIAFPSLASLAEITGYSRRAIGVALTALVEKEAIAIARPWSQHCPTVYAIPDAEPARQTCNQYASGTPGNPAPDAHLTQSRRAPAAPELTTELTTNNTTPTTMPRDAHAVAVQDCMAIGSSVTDRPMVTPRRNTRQRTRERASRDVTPIRDVVLDVMDRIAAKGAA